MPETSPKDVIFWFDYSCPYCYMGLVRLETLQKETPFSVDRRPYLLRPEATRPSIARNPTSLLSAGPTSPPWLTKPPLTQRSTGLTPNSIAPLRRPIGGQAPTWEVSTCSETWRRLAGWTGKQWLTGWVRPLQRLGSGGTRSRCQARHRRNALLPHPGSYVHRQRNAGNTALGHHGGRLTGPLPTRHPGHNPVIIMKIALGRAVPSPSGRGLG